MNDKFKEGTVYLVAKSVIPVFRRLKGKIKGAVGGTRSVFNLCIHGDLSKQIQIIPNWIGLRH